MNPQIRHAQRACEAAKARQAVVVFIDGSGQYAVVSDIAHKALDKAQSMIVWLEQGIENSKEPDNT